MRSGSGTCVARGLDNQTAVWYGMGAMERKAMQFFATVGRYDYRYTVDAGRLIRATDIDGDWITERVAVDWKQRITDFFELDDRVMEAVDA